MDDPVEGDPEAGPSLREELRSALLWFLATAASVWAVFVWNELAASGGWSAEIGIDAAIFTVALLGILGAHEAGHYFVGRAHGFSTSPPRFLPLPIPGTFGTLGAVIRLRSAPPSRLALLEMGAAGPIAGAVVAFVVLWFSVPWMRPGPLIRPGAEIGVFNDPLVVQLIGLWRMGEVPGRYDVYHPAALAGWVGCFLTAINLLPLGQLDGGHVFNALFPGRARFLSVVLLGLALVGAWFYPGWLIWAGLLVLLGAWRGAPVPAVPGVGLRGWGVAALSVLLLVLTFMPIPAEVEEFPPGWSEAP